ncbi:2,3-bisphosphoglycerate-dependent phosphoglycerate mutase, partial [Candidatus Avelusimicrobium faecicola]|uniref:2,3-bisphosphoglycerate-dependent phosphoglycerate mutase n=1 Tax=Candidatus Avelusimicrobium faecicola TaxID=3416205 RepID=UPI003D0C4142
MKRLIFLRHGQSEYNLFHRFTGWDDCALTPEGKEQARQAGVLLRQAGILPQRAYVSKLVRARQTLQNALQTAGWQIPTLSVWQLNERHYGAVQGLTRAEAGRRFGPEQVLLWR